MTGEEFAEAMKDVLKSITLFLKGEGYGVGGEILAYFTSFTPVTFSRFL